MKTKKEICPVCNAEVEYNCCSDRWECTECNYTDLFCPSEAHKYGSERKRNDQ